MSVKDILEGRIKELEAVVEDEKKGFSERGSAAARKDEVEEILKIMNDSITLHEVRGIVTPITNLVALLEMKDEPKARRMIPNAIEVSKESLNTLCRRDLYPVKKVPSMKVPLKVAFNLLDGRMSTDINDVMSMLNFIFGGKLCMNHVPDAIRELESKSPEWFTQGVGIINDIKRSNDTDDFDKLMELIDAGFPDYEVEIFKLER